MIVEGSLELHIEITNYRKKGVKLHIPMILKMWLKDVKNWNKKMSLWCCLTVITGKSCIK